MDPGSTALRVVERGRGRSATLGARLATRAPGSPDGIRGLRAGLGLPGREMGTDAVGWGLLPGLWGHKRTRPLAWPGENEATTQSEVQGVQGLDTRALSPAGSQEGVGLRQSQTRRLAAVPGLERSVAGRSCWEFLQPTWRNFTRSGLQVCPCACLAPPLWVPGLLAPSTALAQNVQASQSRLAPDLLPFCVASADPRRREGPITPVRYKSACGGKYWGAFTLHRAREQLRSHLTG